MSAHTGRPGTPGVFLDRDGTLIQEVGCLDHPDRVEVLPGAVAAVRALNERGWPVVVVSNQAWVARGRMTPAMVDAVNAEVVGRFAAGGARIDAVYYCPHHPDEGEAPWRQACRCRKPGPGLVLEAAAALDIAPERSIVVGDLPSDVALAAAVGARSVLVRSGFGADQWANHRHRFTHQPDVVVDDIVAAVAWIIERAGDRR